MNAVQSVLKAIVGGAVACLTTLGAGFAEGGLSTQEGIAAALAALIAFSAIWAVPNKQP